MSEVVESGDEPAEEGLKFRKGEGDRLWSRSGVRPDEARRGAGKVSHSVVEVAMVVAG